MQLLNVSDVKEMNPDALASNYLMSSYARAFLSGVYMEDDAHDECCRLLYDVWEKISNRHKKIVDRSTLMKGKCQLKAMEYPRVSVFMACQLVDSAKKDKLREILSAPKTT